MTTAKRKRVRKDYERSVYSRSLRAIDAAEERRIVHAVQDGISVRDVAARHHIARERVAEILAKHGAKRPEPQPMPTHRQCVGGCDRRLELNAKNFGARFRDQMSTMCVECADRSRRHTLNIVRVSPRAARAGIAGARRSTR
jgi:hypothetical protein